MSSVKGGLDDLVAHSTVEEVVGLLWHGALPGRKKLEHVPLDRR